MVGSERVLYEAPIALLSGEKEIIGVHRLRVVRGVERHQ